MEYLNIIYICQEMKKGAIPIVNGDFRDHFEVYDYFLIYDFENPLCIKGYLKLYSRY